MSIIDIFHNSRSSKNCWQDYFDKANAITKIMKFLIPVFEYVSNHISTTLHITQPVIDAIVIRDLNAKIGPMIARVCIMEMHSVKNKGILEGETPQARFDHYVKLLCEHKNSIDLFKKYSVLEQHITNIIENYIINFNKILARLEYDWQELSEKFFLQDFDSCVDITTSGDTHASGQSVCILSFSNSTDVTNKKIVYKPRPLQIDRAFYGILKWINKQLTYPQYIPVFISKSEYGWYEYINTCACKNSISVENYYHRLGSLLAIIYLLRGNDMHAENIIAHGEFPIVIDLECLMQPGFNHNLHPGSLNFTRYLVTNTLILPFRAMVQQDYIGFEISALLGSEDNLSPYYQIDWEHAGTDDMLAKRTKIKIPPSQNRPSLQNLTIDPLQYEEYFSAGFSETYTLIANHKALFNSQGLLAAFSDAKIRLVFRHTAIYSKLIYESYHPQIWYFPIKRQEHFAWLLQQRQRDFYQLLYCHEIADLLAGDVPAFYAYADSKTITDAKHQIVAVEAEKSGLELVTQHLTQNFNASDLELQLCLIRQSYACALANQMPTSARHSKHYVPLNHLPRINHGELQNVARTCLDLVLKKLMRLAIISESKISWPTIISSKNFICNPSLTDFSLYNGVAGIGLIFSYANKFFDNNQYRAIAQLCYRTIAATQNSSTELDIGGFSGLGGLIYVMAHFIKNKTADKQASNILSNLVQQLLEKIPQTHEVDIIYGLSGCLAGLQATQPFIDHTIFQAAASQCLTQFFRLCPTPAQFPQSMAHKNLSTSGFAHGIDGVIWSLANFCDAKHQALAQTWLASALQYKSKSISNTNLTFDWCYGITGQALAKFDLPKDYDTAQATEFINWSVDHSLTQAFYRYQNLCHGDLGNIDFLWEIAQKTKNIDLYKNIANIAWQTFNNIINDDYQCERVENCFIPGLMLGEAGIAYLCLRFLHYDYMPNILLLK